MTPRKRARPNSSDQNITDITPPASLPAQNSRLASLLPGRSSSPGMPPKPGDSNTSVATSSRNGKRVRKANSWYGSWPRVSKSPASTQVARENILGDTRRSEATADFSRFDTSKKDAYTDSDRQSTKTLHTISEANTEAQQNEPVSSVRQPETISANDGPRDTTMTSEPDAATHTSTEDVSHAPTSSTGWLSWLSRSAAQGQSEPANENAETHQTTPDTTEPTQPQDLPPMVWFLVLIGKPGSTGGCGAGASK
ncbi:hypothetical protein NUW58_g1831 [Xylaria curta]|uniref:Uncharacterized protein n=1 Tax=Xylaria curta TaxID=42375 RepID=A0ACC1PJE5_9PEZI|nr:hypothetical protein NUW58_g1831 [Xylaria curta]